MGEEQVRTEVGRLADALRSLKRENEDLRRQLALHLKDVEMGRLREDNAVMQRQQAAGIRLQVSPKKGVSLYGIQKFPVTLYKSQWMRVLGAADQIRDFIAKNDGRLKQRPDSDGKE